MSEGNFNSETPTPEATVQPVAAEAELNAKLDKWINGGEETGGSKVEFDNPFTSEPFQVQGILLGAENVGGNIIQHIGIKDPKGNKFSIAMNLGHAKPTPTVESIPTVIATSPTGGLK
jgi:hypothetical protein